MKNIVWITIAVQLIVLCKANNNDQQSEPLGRNYRKNFNNYPMNNGKILSTSETKISSVSYKPSESDSSNLKTAASEEEKFSIGLGVLSPSYSQKFGEDGKTKLDFNSEKGGFSYSLTNVVHPHQPGASSSASLSQGTAATGSSSSNSLNKVQSAGFIPSTYYNQPPPSSPPQQPTPQVNIYSSQSYKQSPDPANQAIYGRLSSNNYPIPPSPTPASPYTPQPQNPLPNPLAVGSTSPYSPQPQNPLANPAALYPADPYSGYNPYSANSALLGPQPPFNPNLSDVEKSFLQTAPGVQPQQSPIATHQHNLQPQQLPSPSQQQPTTQSITQPKLVAQQQLTANPNPANIVHNANYGPYSNPYNANPYGGYPTGLLNMAASQQYPMNMGIDQMGGPNAMNYDYLSSLNDPFMF